MKKVLILFGGNSYEHEVSCKSVNFIINNIDLNKFDYSLVGIDFNNEWYEIQKNTLIEISWKNNALKKIDNITAFLKDFDIVFPMIHGNTCEDGKLQSLFELLNIKYVGSSSYSSLISYDKLITKLILEKYGIPQVPYYIYSENLDYNTLEYPVIVKPCKCGSSIGISVVKDRKDIKRAIKLALKYDTKIIIEKYIKNNRELECAILNKNKKIIASNIGEIINNGKWYDYDSKYNSKSQTIISDIDDDIKFEIKNYSKKIFKILECSNLSRVDFIYDLDNKKLYFNEINTMPGFTDISMYPKLLKDSGIKYVDLISILLS